MRGTTAADSAVQSWLSAEHAFAVKWSHAHASRACARAHARAHAHCWHNWNSLDALHAMQHLAVRGHFSCSAVMAVLGPRNRSEMVTCTRATRACSRAHAHCWHGWEIPVRGHFSTPKQQHDHIYMHACARAHQHGHIYTHGGRGQVLRLLLLFMLLPQRSAGIPLPYCLHVLHACMVAALFRVECSLCTLIVSGCSV